MEGQYDFAGFTSLL